MFLQCGFAQSFEVMPGHKRVFADLQYLKFFDPGQKVSLFARARATSAYNQQATDLFTGAYLNYTTRSGFGGTILGRVASNGSGVDAGVHFFKAKRTFMVYALPSINIGNPLLYSWFSILRYTPPIRENWKVYSSLELFSAFGKEGHLSSAQRIRVGADYKGYQFGPALNLRESPFADRDINMGGFFRKQF